MFQKKSIPPSVFDRGFFVGLRTKARIWRIFQTLGSR